MKTPSRQIEAAFEQGEGIVRLSPTWVPRVYCIPGRRIKLHPDDYYAYGTHRGGIDERWLSSTTPAQNGPDTSRDEGLSKVVFENRESFLLRDAMDELQDRLIGSAIWEKHRSWPMYSKFFDNLGPLPHHVHHRDEHAALVGQKGKPEAYYFPLQLNNHGGRFPHTYFGLEPGTSRDQLLECLRNFTSRDNRITDLSKAYRLKPGTGWDVPPGILHAPGSLCTYEPQRASDIFAMYQSVTDEQPLPSELLWLNTPEDRVGDFEYLVDVLDWEANVDPAFRANHYMEPMPRFSEAEARDRGFQEAWVCYRSDHYSAAELTVDPGREIQVSNAAAYGLIMLQGHGTLNNHPIETPSQIRFGQLTRDEYFVSETIAKAGVTICNASDSDPLVMLKHFGPENPDVAEVVRRSGSISSD